MNASAYLLEVTYLVASVLFILGLKGLSHPDTARRGMIMAAAALLKEKPKPTDTDINNTITNICRCGTFQQVRAAIHAAAGA